MSPDELVDAWIKAKCELKGHVRSSIAWQSFLAYCKSVHQPAPQRKEWAILMRAKGIPAYFAACNYVYRSGLSV